MDPRYAPPCVTSLRYPMRYLVYMASTYVVLGARERGGASSPLVCSTLLGLYYVRRSISSTTKLLTTKPKKKANDVSSSRPETSKNATADRPAFLDMI